jgi:hypothetical protein
MTEPQGDTNARATRIRLPWATMFNRFAVLSQQKKPIQSKPQQKNDCRQNPKKVVNPTFSTGQDEPRPQDLSHWLEARLGSASEAGRLIDLRLAASPGLALELVPTRALTSDQGTSTYTLNGCNAMKYRGHQNFFTQPPWQTGTHRR